MAEISAVDQSYDTPTYDGYNHRTIMNSSYIDELEKRLHVFTSEWEETLKRRIFFWRARLLGGFVLSLLIPLVFPAFSWLWLVVMGMSAGSLFSLLKADSDMKKHISRCKEHIRQARIIDNVPEKYRVSFGKTLS